MGRFDNRKDTEEAEQPEMTGGIVAEFHARISALEQSNADLREQLDKAKAAGTVELDTAHIAHVLNKHFYHDRPEPNDASKQGSG